MPPTSKYAKLQGLADTVARMTATVQAGGRVNLRTLRDMLAVLERDIDVSANVPGYNKSSRELFQKAVSKIISYGMTIEEMIDDQADDETVIRHLAAIEAGLRSIHFVARPAAITQPKPEHDPKLDDVDKIFRGDN